MTTGLSIPKDITSCQNAACNWEIATNESVSRLLQVPRLAAILCDDDCKSLSSLSQEAITVVPEFLLTIYKHCHAPHYDNTAMQWPRMIQGTIAAMNRHANIVSFQIGGSKLLRDLSSKDIFIRHILRNGGLPALNAAQNSPHRVSAADECLQHILSLDLQMVQFQKTSAGGIIVFRFRE
jgi:hypothetical protein